MKVQKVLGILGGGLTSLVVATAAFADNSMGSMGSMSHMSMMGKKVTITGTVTDYSCFIANGLHGPKHIACAKACIAQGQEMGIMLDDGSIVAVFGTGPNDHLPNAKLAPYAEKRVSVTGTEFSGHGITGIQIATVKAAQ